MLEDYTFEPQDPLVCDRKHAAQIEAQNTPLGSATEPHLFTALCESARASNRRDCPSAFEATLLQILQRASKLRRNAHDIIGTTESSFR
jgi:hypothetical protein